MKRIRYPIAIFVPVDSSITDVAVAILKNTRSCNVCSRYSCWMMSPFNIVKFPICWCSDIVVLLKLLD
jgi:hypothetical protein